MLQQIKSKKHLKTMETQQQIDEKFMRQALNEAQQALERREVPIGPVVVGEGGWFGRGSCLVETLNDATAHAEMQAITSAAATLGGKYLEKSILYVTVEPCAMCAGASAWSQVARIVWGADDAKRGFSTISKSILHPKTEIVGGVLGEECAELMRGFFEKLR